MKANYKLENFSKIISKSISLAEVCKKLGLVPIGGNYQTVKWHIKLYNLDISHFTGQSWAKGLKLNSKPRINNDEFFLKNTNHSSHHTRIRLFKSKIKEEKCESCKLEKWLDKPIPLEVDHIDGDKFNNELSNLRILCANCHAQTSSYRGRSKKRYARVAQLVSAADLNPAGVKSV